MVMFGSKGVTSTTGEGEFYCPQCNRDRSYHLKRVQRFFAFFVPLIPLDVQGEYIECQQCDCTYREDVLALDPQGDIAEFQAQFKLTIKRIMILMMLADGVIDDEERTAIRGIFSKISGSELSEADLVGDIEKAERSEQKVIPYLREVAPYLNANGKEMVVKAAFLVAAADGVFQDEEKALFAEIVSALEMSAGRVNHIIDELTKTGHPAAGMEGGS